MRIGVAIAVAASVLAPAMAAAQEPSHLERFTGECRTAQGEALGAYAGRVLWMADGQFSGMLTRVSDAPAAEGAPRSITVVKQTPVEADGGWTISAEAGETAVTCTLAHAEVSNG